MISNRFPLAATLLAAGAFLFLPTPARADSEGETPQEAENSHVVELKLMARRLMERVEDHRERLTRLEFLIRYHGARGQADEVRKLEALKQREVESFEQTLAEIHRLLGSQDFERVSKAVRYLGNQATHAEPGEPQESAAVATNAREASAAVSQSAAGADRIQASPVIAKDGAILVGSQDDHLYALEPDGRLRWFLSFDADVDAPVAVAADGTVYVGGDDRALRASR